MDERMRQVLARARSMIDQHGWMVQMVGDSPPFAYTVGLSETLGHPEVFMVGFDPGMMHGLLNDIGALVREGANFSAPTLCDRVIENFDVAFRPASRESVGENSGVGQALVGPFDAVQVFLPDAKGLFPWDEGCDPRYAEVQTGLLEAVGDEPSARAEGPRLH